MNETQKKLAAKVERMTKRLETVITDDSRTEIENARAATEYAALAETLAAMLPRMTLSPDERVERLSRAVEGATPNPTYMEPDIVKLERVTARIHELVPDADLSLDQKLEILGTKFAAAFPHLAGKAS